VEGEALGPAKVGPQCRGIWGGAVRGMYERNTHMGEGEGRGWGLMDRKPGKGIKFEK